jgi:putative isomerase
MKTILLAGMAALLAAPVWAEENPEWKTHVPLIRQHIYQDYKLMFREKGKGLEYPFMVPGSAQYQDELWDWDSWLSDIALRQILLDAGEAKDRAEAMVHEQGCVLNFLHNANWDGWIPSTLVRGRRWFAVAPRSGPAISMR